MRIFKFTKWEQRPLFKPFGQDFILKRFSLRKCWTKVEDQTFKQDLDDLLQFYAKLQRDLEIILLNPHCMFYWMRERSLLSPWAQLPMITWAFGRVTALIATSLSKRASLVLTTWVWWPFGLFGLILWATFSMLQLQLRPQIKCT